MNVHIIVIAFFAKEEKMGTQIITRERVITKNGEEKGLPRGSIQNTETLEEAASRILHELSCVRIPSPCFTYAANHRSKEGIEIYMVTHGWQASDATDLSANCTLTIPALVHTSERGIVERTFEQHHGDATTLNMIARAYQRHQS